ncbi:hypothetical protein ACHAWC_002716 [Mediolabrus comicus]
MPTIAVWGSPEGSNTSANSAIGAVPSGWAIEAVTIKKCTKQHNVMISYPPISFFVMPLFGMRMRNSQNSCGKNVATLNACLIFSVVNNPAVKSSDDDSAAESMWFRIVKSSNCGDNES